MTDEALARQMFYSASKRSAKAGREFSLTRADVERMMQTPKCAYCDVTVGKGENGRAHNSASLDRIDADKGYTLDNTALCCWACNHHKSNATPNELRRLADRVDALLAERQGLSQSSPLPESIDGGLYLVGKAWYTRFSIAGRTYRESTRTSDRDLALRLLHKRHAQAMLAASRQSTSDADSTRTYARDL